MNIVVLGGAGDMGRHIVQDLIEHSDAGVIIADYQLSKAQALARRFGERAQGVFVDASNRDSLLLALRDADVAVGAVGPFYRFGPRMAWAALESHVNYVDICDDYSPVETLYEFDAVARNLGVTVITGLGWTPGLSNVLARHGANRLDQADEIHIAWVGGAADSQGLAVVKHVLYAVSGRVPTYRDARWVKVPALSEPEVVEFPEPLGEIEVFHVGHPEPITIPRTIPAWTVSLKGALTPRWNNRLAAVLVRLGATTTASRIDRVSRLIHRLEGVLGSGGVALSAVRVDVIGTRGSEHVRLTYTAADHMGRLTGIPASVGALMLARGEITEPGVFAPEAIVDPVPFLAALAERGIQITEHEAVIPEAVAEEMPAEIEAGEAIAAEAPAIPDVPPAGPAEVEAVPATDRVPSAALREGEVVEVVLALDQDGPTVPETASSPEVSPSAVEMTATDDSRPGAEGQPSTSETIQVHPVSEEE